MPEPGLSRRDFLRLAGLAGAGLAASQVGPLVDALVGSGSGSKTFETSTVEGMAVIGYDQPLTGADLKGFEESSKGKETGESPARMVDFLVGKKAIDSWANGEKGVEENLPVYIKKHIERVNQILKKTRPSSGVNSLQIIPRLIVVDDDWLRTQNIYTRQFSGCADAVGRFSIDSTYSPRDSDYYHNKYDDGLLHELTHYALFDQYHLWLYFGRKKTWDEGLNVSKMPESIDKTKIRLWGLNNPDVEDKIDLLTSASTRWGMSGSLLSEPDELCIRNACLNGYNFRNWAELATREPETVFNKESMATEYRFSAPGLEDGNPRLYVANVTSSDTREMIYSEVKPSPTPLRIDVDEVILPTELVAGYSEILKTRQKTVKVFLLVFDIAGEKRVYGFTSWHLAYWHWKEQIRLGEPMIGAKGKRHPISLNLDSFVV